MNTGIRNQASDVILRLFSKEDLSDKEILAFIRERGRDLSEKEYQAYLKSHETRNSKPRRILNVLATAESDGFRPDRCNVKGALKAKFNPSDLTIPECWLSQPGSTVFLKKTSGVKYEGVLENRRLAPTWSEGILASPVSMERKFVFQVTLIFPHKSIITLPSERLYDFFGELAWAIRASYGFVGNRAHIEGLNFDVSRAVEKGKLPDMFWINYFGADWLAQANANHRSLIKRTPYNRLDKDCIFMLSNSVDFYQKSFFGDTLLRMLLRVDFEEA